MNRESFEEKLLNVLGEISESLKNIEQSAKDSQKNEIDKISDSVLHDMNQKIKSQGSGKSALTV